MGGKKRFALNSKETTGYDIIFYVSLHLTWIFTWSKILSSDSLQKILR